MAKKSKFPPEVRERAVRMVFAHGGEHLSQWDCMPSSPALISTRSRHGGRRA